MGKAGETFMFPKVSLWKAFTWWSCPHISILHTAYTIPVHFLWVPACIHSPLSYIDFYGKNYIPDHWVTDHHVFQHPRWWAGRDTYFSPPCCWHALPLFFFHLQALALLLLVPELLLPDFSPPVPTHLLSCALSLCLAFPPAGRCEAFSKHTAGSQQCLVSRRKLPNVPTHSSEIFQRSFPSLIPQLCGMESEVRRGELACPAYTAWTQHGAVVHPAYVRLCYSSAECFPVQAVAGGDIGKQMFLSWKSCSWILNCVYIPSRYAMWKCLEIGNSVPAEWVKGMRLKKKSLSSFPRDLPNSLFLRLICTSCRCVCSNFPSGIFLLHGTSSTDAHSPEGRAGSVNDKWNTYCQWESVRKGMWPGAHTRACRLHGSGWAHRVLFLLF